MENDRYERVAWGALLVLLVLLPLTFFPATSEIFVVPKAVLLWVLAFGAAGVVAVGDLKQSLLRIPEGPGARSLAAFCVAALGGTLLSPVPFVSFLGAFARREGLLTLLSYALIYFLALRLATTEERVRQGVWALILPVLPTGMYATAQAFGFEFMRGLNPSRVSVRAYAALGNADLLGIYAALVLPVLLIAYVHSRGARRAYVGISIVADVLALLFSYYRGGWLGATVGVAVLAALLGTSVIRRRLVQVLSVAAIIAVTATLAVGLRYIQPRPSVTETFAERAASVGRFGEGTAATRLQVWPRALSLVARRPLLGFGPEAFRGQFMPIRGKRIVQLEGTARWDRPHNSLLYLAVSTGLVGLGCYLAFFISVVATVVRSRNAGDRGLALGLAAGVVAASVSEFFVFWSVAVTPIVFAAMGLAVASTKLTEPGRVSLRELRMPPTGAVAAVATTAAILAGVAWAGAESAWGDHYAKVGQVATAGGKRNEGTLAYSKAVDTAWWINDYRWRAAVGWEGMGLGSASYANLARAAAILKAGLAVDPFDEEAYILLGEIYRYMATIGGSKTMPLAIASYRTALRLDPFSPTAHGGLARALNLQGDFRGSVVEARKGLEFDPGNKDLLYWLGWSYIRLGDKRQARASFERALRIDPHLEPARAALRTLDR